jgi:Lysozyme like domain
MTIHKLDALQLDELLKKAGFPDPDVAQVISPAGNLCRRSAWAKAMAESGGYYDIIGGPNPNGTYDYGLFQFNGIYEKDPTIEWDRILEPLYNAQLCARWSKQGKDWSSWGIGESGWAGNLKKSNPAAWQMIQNAYTKWYDLYPSYIAAAKEALLLIPVKLANLKPGLRNADVLTYQNALRKFLIARNLLGTLNPSGATGYYGTETKNMTKAVYTYLAKTTGQSSWLSGDITTPGPSMLTKIGLRATY